MKKFSKDVFTARLRNLRGERSQKIAAAICGMKQPMYARYESGATLPSAELMFRLCTSFDESADYLLGLTDTPKSKSSPGGELFTQVTGNTGLVIANGSGASINAPVNVTLNAPVKQGRKAPLAKRGKSTPPPPVLDSFTDAG